MNPELEIKEAQFFATDVEGYWDDSSVSLYCDDDLYCSDYITVLE